jgi:hypothetical protein
VPGHYTDFGQQRGAQTTLCATVKIGTTQSEVR